MKSDKILELKNISKLYPGVKALDKVSFNINRGEVHALLGENGAGKSTLIKAITGAIKPSEGKIIYENKGYDYFEPSEALNIGIGAIYQEFNLIPSLSISENIFYGREKMKGCFVDFKSMNKDTKKLLDEFGINVNPSTLVKDLGVAYQQIVEILKAVSQDVKVLIMDEPSAPLTNKEIKAMFKVIQNLKSKGVTIIYISHRLEELFEICERVSVMRDGKYIKTLNVKDTNRKELISLMVGRELGESYPINENSSDKVIMKVKNLNTKKIKDVSFYLKEGEILGFGGLVGAGRTEVARAVFGADSLQSGEIYLNDKIVNIKSPSDAINAGIGLVPEDRKRQGVLLELSVKENISFSSIDKFINGIFINKELENKNTENLASELKIKTPTIDQKVKNLSGGNQQKVALAKWLSTNCDILIFDEPTRGIDVGAKQEIYCLMNELAKKGKSIIMISSEMPELIGMADRVIVMNEGRIVGELKKNEATQEKILDLASGE